MAENEEFELVPISPLRRLERRLDKMESTKGVDVKEFFNQLVEIVRMNQQLVDELAKANDALRIELSKLPGRMDEMIDNMNELISFIKAAGSADVSEGGSDLKPLLKRMDALVEGNKKLVESNEAMMSSIDQLSSKLNRPKRMRPVPKTKLSKFKKRY